MPLSFAPDFQTNGDPSASISTFDDSFVSDGVPGNELFLWLIGERNGSLPAGLTATQFDASDNPVGTLVVVAERDLSDARLFVAHGTRGPGLDHVTVAFTTASGPAGWIWATFPGGNWVVAADEDLSGTADSFSASGAGIFAGVVSTELGTSLAVTPTGAGDFDVASELTTGAFPSMIAGFAYESGSADAGFDVSTDGDLGHGYVLRLGEDSWHVGGVGRSW